MKSCAIAVVDGKPAMYTFTSFDNAQYVKLEEDLIDKKVSKIGSKQYTIGDEIITYWSDDRVNCYHGRIIDIDEEQCVLLAKMFDGNESWLPFDFVHKLVVPSHKDLGFLEPDEAAQVQIAALQRKNAEMQTEIESL